MITLIDMKQAKLDFEAVERLMVGRGITNQAQLAREVGLERQNITRMRRLPEKATLRTISRLCHALRCTPGDILVIK